MLGALNPLGVGWSIQSILSALMSLIFSGCMVAAMGNRVAMGDDFTPEQIEAYRKVGVRVYGCINVGGPPPAGNTVFLLVPEGAVYNPIWSDGCHIRN